MKKQVLKITVMLVFCLIFAGCDPSIQSYTDLKPDSAIEKIELIDYHNPEVKETKNYHDPNITRVFDDEKVELLETLPAEQIPQFITGFSNLQLAIGKFTHADGPFGISLRIVYKDGTFIVMSVDDQKAYFSFIAGYDNQGNLTKYLAMLFSEKTEYFDLINTYFSYPLH